MSEVCCQDCGAPAPRVSIDGVVLCDRCADAREARITGYPELPDPPSPVTVRGPDNRHHALSFRVWRAPPGIEVALEETGVPGGDAGYHFAVLGAHDADVDALAQAVTERAEQEIARQQLEPNPHRSGWLLRGDHLAGRLLWNENRGYGGPYDVVIDGRTLTWEELGQALESYEGWRLRLVLEDPCDDLRPDAEVIALPTRDIQEPQSMPTRPGPVPAIDAVLADFLAEQEKRLAPRTFRNYADVISLLTDCLNGYGHQSPLDAAERRRWETAFDGDDEEAFVRVFGPEKIAENLGEFLDYFMIRKVMAGEELLRAAGTVTEKLAKWLGDRGYLDGVAVEDAVERGTAAARDLPKAEKLSRLLYDHASRRLSMLGPSVSTTTSRTTSRSTEWSRANSGSRAALAP